MQEIDPRPFHVYIYITTTWNDSRHHRRAREDCQEKQSFRASLEGQALKKLNTTRYTSCWPNTDKLSALWQAQRPQHHTCFCLDRFQRLVLHSCGSAACLQCMCLQTAVGISMKTCGENSANESTCLKPSRPYHQQDHRLKHIKSTRVI